MTEWNDNLPPHVPLVCEWCKTSFSVPRNRLKHQNPRFCSRECSNEWRTAQFWEKIDRPADPDACWLWLGSGIINGYGRTKVNGTSTSVHRLMWAIVNGPIPDGMYVLHKCDVRRCVNPDHLFLGTHQDNMDDMVAKGRGLPKERTTPYMRPETIRRGETNNKAKLTEAQVIAIRIQFTRGVTMKALASAYDVSGPQVSNIIHRRQWKHVPDNEVA